MDKPVLVIMAAGMGSRYGGLKQIDPVDEQGNIIMDFSIYDAVRAGFKKVVFIIKHQIEEEFKRSIGERIAKYVEVEYVFQELDKLPEGFSIPEGRVHTGPRYSRALRRYRRCHSAKARWDRSWRDAHWRTDPARGASRR